MITVDRVIHVPSGETLLPGDPRTGTGLATDWASARISLVVVLAGATDVEIRGAYDASKTEWYHTGRLTRRETLNVQQQARKLVDDVVYDYRASMIPHDD